MKPGSSREYYNYKKNYVIFGEKVFCSINQYSLKIVSLKGC